MAASRGDGHGGEVAFSKLCGRYLELTYGLCLRYLRDAGLAEDATMEIFGTLREKLVAREVRRFRPWLYTMARNHCLMRLRRPRSAAPDTLSPSDVDFDDVTHHLEERGGEEARFAALDACMEKLPEGQATCIRKFYLEGLSYAELATLLDWTVGKVRSSIQNGRRNLRRCIERNSNHE